MEKKVFPASFAQQRLWFLDQFEPNSSAYNISSALRFKGVLDIAALEQSLKEIMRRHEALRTIFAVEEGQPVQVILASQSLPLSVVDLVNHPESERESEARRIATEEAQRPFDLGRGPLLRVAVLRLGEKDHLLVVIMHHIVSDGWSMGVFFRELSILYAAISKGELLSLPELPMQYADYAIWQRQRLQGQLLDRQLSYWKKQLENISTLQLPADRPRPAAQSFRGAKQSLALTKELTEGLKALSRQQKVTPFMILLAAFQTQLHRYTGQEDIAVGSPIAGRTRADFEGLLGFFANTLVLRGDLSGNPTFLELVARLREVALEAYDHQDMPFEKLVGELQPERTLSHSPLFQIAFALQNVPRRAIELPGVTANPIEIENRTAKFDLFLAIFDEPQGFRARIEYNTDLFDPSTIARMLDHFRNLLQSVVANPKQRLSHVPLLTPIEKHQLLIEWNDTNRDYPSDKCIHELFEAQAERTPDAVAVVFEARQLTYRELNRRANQLAHYLHKLGVGPETLVGVCLERSLEMIVALFGILKAGGAYVPLDPSYPKERLAFMLDDSRAPVLLTQERLANELIEDRGLRIEDGGSGMEDSDPRFSIFHPRLKRVCLDTDWKVIAWESTDNPQNDAVAENLAYVIYTSGSTGQPKGVAVEHRQLVNYVVSILVRLNLPADSSFATVSTIAADLGNTVVFASLCRGDSLHLIGQDRVADSEAMAEYSSRHSIDCIKFVPSHLSALQISSHPERILPRRLLVLGGEACSWEWIKGLQEMAPDLQILNHYGPTEATVGILTYEVKDQALNPGSSIVPIGRPLSNMQVYLLDSYLNPMPLGVPGELHAGGFGLSRGYLNRPDLTAEKFIPNPFSDNPGARLYRTGDMARYLPDGNIEFLGRTDNQIKLRGYRIEPGEIEAVLRQHPLVREAMVLAREDYRSADCELQNAEGQGETSKFETRNSKSADKRLVAYVVANQNRGPTIGGKQRYKLPSGVAIAQLNKNETDYIYEEIFERQAYLRHGITLNDGDCIFDVGANIGLFVLFAHQVSKRPKVYSFEPNPRLHDILRTNASLCGANVRLFDCGLSNQAKSAAFTFFRGFSLLSGFYADPQTEKEVVKTFMANQQAAGVSEMAELIAEAEAILDERFQPESFSVQLRTLSSVIEEEQIESIDLLKINVEKSELDVLNGIKETDWEKIKQIVLEVDVEENLPAICALLEKHGFEFAVEQDWLLHNTPLCYVYAIRPGGGRALIYEQNKGAHIRQLSRLGERFLSAGELRSFLGEKLPTYMMPSAFVILDKFPLTSNGKLDHRALPAPDHGGPELEEKFAAPLTPVQEALAKIWADVLRLERVAIHDNFFELGGHSLLATQVIARMHGVFQKDIPLRALFEKPTIAELAITIAEKAEKARLEEISRVLVELETLSEEETQQYLLKNENSTGSKGA